MGYEFSQKPTGFCANLRGETEIETETSAWDSAQPKLFTFMLDPESNLELLFGAPGIATRTKDATRGSWPYY